MSDGMRCEICGVYMTEVGKTCHDDCRLMINAARRTMKRRHEGECDDEAEWRWKEVQAHVKWLLAQPHGSVKEVIGEQGENALLAFQIHSGTRSAISEAMEPRGVSGMGWLFSIYIEGVMKAYSLNNHEAYIFAGKRAKGYIDGCIIKDHDAREIVEAMDRYAKLGAIDFGRRLRNEP